MEGIALPRRSQAEADPAMPPFPGIQAMKQTPEIEPRQPPCPSDRNGSYRLVQVNTG
jgi:hypothetical protein